LHRLLSRKTGPTLNGYAMIKSATDIGKGRIRIGNRRAAGFAAFSLTSSPTCQPYIHRSGPKSVKTPFNWVNESKAWGQKTALVRHINRRTSSAQTREPSASH